MFKNTLLESFQNIPNDVGAVMFSADAHFQNGYVHLFIQENVKSYNSQDLEIGWHIQFMFLKQCKSSNI